MDINKCLIVYFLSLLFLSSAKSSNIEKLNRQLAKYDYVDCIYNGLIKVKKNGKCGFINKKGKEIVSFDNDYEDMGDVSNFHSSICPLKLHDSIILIDRKGEIVKTPTIRAIENDIIYFQNGLGIIGNKGIKYLDNNMYDIRFSDSYFVLDCDNGTKEYSLLYDSNGDLIMKYDHICFQYKSREEDAKKNFIVKKNGKYGIVNENNKTIFPFIQSDCNYFHADGNYIFFEDSTGKTGVMSRNCDTILPIGYENYHCYKNYVFIWDNENFDMVYDNKCIDELKFGDLHIKKEDNSLVLIANRKRIKADWFYIENELLVYATGGVYGILDKSGEIILEQKYVNVEIFNNLIIAYEDFNSIDSKVSLFRKDGHNLESELYYNVCLFDNFKRNSIYRIFKKQDIDTNENIVYVWNEEKKRFYKSPTSFVCPYGVHNGLLRIVDNGVYKFIKVK